MPEPSEMALGDPEFRCSPVYEGSDHKTVREVLNLVLFLYHSITLSDCYSPSKIFNR